MIETPDVGTTVTTVTTTATAAAAAAAVAPSNEEDGTVIQEDNEDDATERELKLLQESQGWWFPKTKLSTWVSPPRVYELIEL